MNDLVTFAEIGRRLGLSRQTVYMWHVRRSRNGFPQPASQYIFNHRKCPLFDWSAVSTWHENYVPNVGGRPAAQPVDTTL